MDFSSIYTHGLVRVAACVPRIELGNPRVNAAAVAQQARQCHHDGVAVAVFPELVLTGASLGDLMAHSSVQADTYAALAQLSQDTASWRPLLIVGAALQVNDRLYNCAVVMQRGQILGVVPASNRAGAAVNTPSWFSVEPAAAQTIDVAGFTVPFDPELRFRATDVTDLQVAVTIGDPLRVATESQLAGTTVIAGLSAPRAWGGAAQKRRQQVLASTGLQSNAMVICGAAQGESTTDSVYDSQGFIAEAGQLLAASPPLAVEPGILSADVDLEALAALQLTHPSPVLASKSPLVEFALTPPKTDIGVRREVPRFPFLPADADLDDSTYDDSTYMEIFDIQVQALARRLDSIGRPKVVLGVSAGLDSTLALLVAKSALELLGRDGHHLHGYFLPGFATASTTRERAFMLMEAVGASATEIDIRPAAQQMLADLNHPFADGEPVYDTTFENVQAGLRTDYLFRLANSVGGIVLGTGDLSELALGWCTYGVGDQMSHYAVNAGVPKTLVQALLRWACRDSRFSEATQSVIAQVLAQEISPELVPTSDGGAPQSTQATIGPYELQDFTLYHVLRYGFGPAKIAFLAHHAWRDQHRGAWPRGLAAEEHNAYDLPTIIRWLHVFGNRFFSSQFKRSALPDGPTVVEAGSLSPRAGWRQPSDMGAGQWRRQLEAVSTS